MLEKHRTRLTMVERWVRKAKELRKFLWLLDISPAILTLSDARLWC